MTTPREQLGEGLALHRAGNLDAAAEIYNAVLAADADNADANHFLGLIAHQSGDNLAAERRIRKAIAVESARPTFHYNLGNVLAAMGRWEDAAAAGTRAVELDPTRADAQYSLGTVLGQLRRYDLAEKAFRRGLEIQPQYPEALSGLAAALHRQGRSDEAVVAAREALVQAPDLPQAHTNLGNALAGLGELEDAEEHHRAALSVAPGFATAHYNLARLLMELGRPQDAKASFRQALEIQPDYPDASDNLLLNLNYDDGETERSISEAHVAWAASVGETQPTDPVNHTNSRIADRPLRIGYVSADFRMHSCAYFIEPVLTGHHRDHYSTYLYANLDNPDHVTERLRGQADHWRDIRALNDQAAAAIIREDQIDILVDLSGHTRGNRLGVFAQRPAPIQVTWLGYPATTGLSEMDYRLTDAIADPSGAADDCHTERLIRLDSGFCCYSPPVDVPPLTGPPLTRSGQITFGSFNNPHKLSRATIDLWARVLERVGDSTLLLKGRGLERATTVERLKAAFAGHGITPDRIRSHGWIARDDGPLALYNEVDVALDPTPYNGTTTTLEALLMGVPVVTLAGDRHAARVGASLLSRLGRGEWIANTIDDYVSIAAELANNHASLSEKRELLRNELIESPLCDVQLFISALEGAYRNIWQRWCRA